VVICLFLANEHLPVVAEAQSNNFLQWPTYQTNVKYDSTSTSTDEQETNINTSACTAFCLNGKSNTIQQTIELRGGSIFAGWNPLGYGITQLGLEFLAFDGSLDSDVGRFLAGFKSGRKRHSALKQQWLEIVRVSKQGQSMRIYRKLDELIAFCVRAGFLY